LGATPVHIDIPSTGTHAEVIPLGEETDGTMEAPSDPDTVGWYAPGFGLGVAGNALLDGHVDWGGRPRVFGMLRTLAQGDEVTLTAEDGSAYRYEVSWIKLYQANAAPLDDIFAGDGGEEITLITCGGAFDPVARMYVSRWIVRATRAD
jgi:sortase A